jgi:predicted phosphodiesterase
VRFSRFWNRLHRLRPKEKYDRALNAALGALHREKTTADKRSQGVVHLDERKPTLVISDIHGRMDYLLSVLMTKNPEYGGKTHLSLLKSGELQVVLLGDALHTEHPNAWTEISNHLFQGPNLVSEPLEQEVAVSLNTMSYIMHLKGRYAQNFHYIKGNHDNIRNSDANGDRGFRKFLRGAIGDGQVFEHFVRTQFGKRFLEKWAAFEAALPIMAKGKNVLLSHSGPKTGLTRGEIEQRSTNAIQGLTWTNLVKKDAIQSEAASSLLRQFEMPSGIYLAGHRHPAGSVKFTKQGPFYQFNPDAPNQHYAILPAHRGFNAEYDIREAAPWSKHLVQRDGKAESVEASLRAMGL